MTDKDIKAKAYEDFVQSSNSLFHFMGKYEYLEAAIQDKALSPRYCVENIEYLNLKLNEEHFTEIAVLQKCFCDIPLHNIMKSFEINEVDNEIGSLSESDKLGKNTHPGFYGEFAIAFSKGWGQKMKLQPVHYLNEDSYYTESFTDFFNSAIEDEHLSDDYSDEILSRLSFFKPIRGIMPKDFGKLGVINISKNFHDEHEWRYIPQRSTLKKLKLHSVIANLKTIENKDDINIINKNINSKEYEKIKLKFNYDDIKYILVPNSNFRNDIIDTIKMIPTTSMDNIGEVEMQKYILISKILVLDEIRKDW